MLRVILLVVAAASLGHASQIGVLHYPSYVQFNELPSGIALSEIQSQLQHLMGFTVTSGTDSFVPFAQTGLFRRPKAAVAIQIDGLDYVPVDTTPIFKLVEDSDDADLTHLFASVRRLFEKDGSLGIDYDATTAADALSGTGASADASSNDAQADAAIVLQNAELATVRGGASWSLKPTEAVDAAFLLEIRRLLTMCSRIAELGQRTADSVPDVFAFRVRAFAQLSTKYGSFAPQTKDAIQILRFVIGKMKEVFSKAYESNVVVLVYGLSGSESSPLQYRVKRQAASSEPESTAEPPAINLAPSYTDNYAAFFNILLWLVVGIAITVLIISWVLWTMDPGQDSIIYRMVQLPRIKKEL